MAWWRFFLALTILWELAGTVSAHPVPKNTYDRVIVARLLPGNAPREMRLVVDFRLEVDPDTIVLVDMLPYRDEIDVSKIVKRIDYFAEFARIYADVYARRLLVEVNGDEVELSCVRRQQTFDDETGKPLDHLRCDFQFEAKFNIEAFAPMRLRLRDLSYQDQPGKIHLSFENRAAMLLALKAPDKARQELPFIERGPRDESILRNIEAVFRLPGPILSADTEVRRVLSFGKGPVEWGPAPEAVEITAPPPSTTSADDLSADAPAPPRRATPHEDKHEGPSLLRLFLTSDHGLGWLLLLAAGFGAIHALTPGHGKTMVAAYLVGERGTVYHAIFLGMVTTLTHTGVVLLLAALLLFAPSSMSADMRQGIQTGLGLAMGLLIVCLGFFLLLQRLSGRADHIHLGGGHHHQHHAHAPAVETAGDQATPKRPGWWGLLILGVSGGLIPCWDAIALLVMSVGTGEFWLALPMVLSFSAGLAGVLVLIGIAVVKFRNILGKHREEGRLVRALPIVSAIVVTAMGFWVCYEAVHGGG